MSRYLMDCVSVGPKGKIEFPLQGPKGRQNHALREDIRRGCFGAVQMLDGTLQEFMNRDAIQGQFFNDPRLWLKGQGPHGIVLGPRPRVLEDIVHPTSISKES